MIIILILNNVLLFAKAPKFNDISLIATPMINSRLKLALTVVIGCTALSLPAIANDQSLDGQSLDGQDSDQSVAAESMVDYSQHIAQAEPTATPVAQSPAAPSGNQFSNTTKLQGQVIFGLTSGLSGDISRNAVLGHRTRLELITSLGNGTLTTRLQASGLGLSNNAPGATVTTPEGTSSFADGATDSRVGIGLLRYEMPIGPNTQMMVVANAAGEDEFTDSINPLFDGDGAFGAISRFGNRPSIYYFATGAGAGVRHKFSENLEGSVVYLANSANNPAPGSGLTAGGYGAIAQLAYKSPNNPNTKVGFTYVNAYNANPGTGSNNANPGGASNMFGIAASVGVSSNLALGGWVGYNKNNTAEGDRDILNWAVTAAFPDLGAPGNLGGLIVGQEPRVTSASGTAVADPGSSLHLEGFYQFKVSENVSITPGLIYLTAPDHNSANAGALIGVIRTTFTF
jgi:hypothetical protein